MSDIRDIIRAAAEEQGAEIDLDVLATAVAERTPKNRLMEFYTYALRQLVADVIRADRQMNLDNAMKDRAAPPPSNRSPKLKDRRDWWAEMLASHVHLGNSLYKALGDCTIDDLEFCVDERELNIRRIQGQVQNYRQLIQLMVKHGARTVAGLPPQKDWKAAA